MLRNYLFIHHRRQGQPQICGRPGYWPGLNAPYQIGVPGSCPPDPLLRPFLLDAI